MTFAKFLGRTALRAGLAGWFVLNASAQSAATTPALSKSDYAETALRETGDPAKGRAVFSGERAFCARCHSVDGTSRLAGPDLFAIGDKFPRRELVRAILHPSESIAIGYGATVVETQSGEEHVGVVKLVSDDWLELVGADGQRTRVPKSEIAAQRTGQTSLMPEGLESGLTAAEFTDLIAYLETLRQPLSSGGSDVTRNEIAACVAPARFVPFFDETTRFQRPVWFGAVPGTTNRFVVLEHAGQSWLVERLAGGDRRTTLVDLRGVVREGGATGLLGLAFHPRFAENGRYFLKYHVVEGGRIFTLVTERKLMADPWRDAGTSREILRVEAVTQDHNGGAIEFGPDGFLYIGTGDTGPQRDPRGHGQNLGLLLAKMLRIDVDHPEEGKAYGIPRDNPFLGRTGVRPEIWAYGFREPWRFTFDSLTGDLWVGDVGQDQFEEVGIVRSGENHGWNVIEGGAPFSDQHRRAGERFVSPVLSYPHRLGVSVTGGYVYRGHRATAMQGRYVFGDFESRRVWALAQTNRVLRSVVEIGRAPSRVVSFSQDQRGELYVVGYDSGVIYSIDFSGVDLTPLETRILVATAETATHSWKYRLSTPADGWQRNDFDDSDWSVGPGGFGTRGTPGAVVRTEWRSADIWLRRRFELPEGFRGRSLGRLALRVHHDEDAEVYLNGVEIARLARWTSGYTDLPLTAEAMKALRAGENFLAIHCHQNSGGQYIDAGIVEWVASPRAD